jgi:hypothetical protein
MHKIVRRGALALGAATVAIMLVSPAANASTGQSANARSGASAAQSATFTPDGCVSDGQGFTDCTYTVHPRVGTCGGYDGTIWWQDDNFGTEYIGAKGKVWNHCSSGVMWAHLAFKQDAGLVSYNESIGHAGANSTVSINYEKVLVYPGGVSSVHMYVCSTIGSWHCGASVYV